jgi:hypothetical protein
MFFTHGLPDRSSSFPACASDQIDVGEPVPAVAMKRSGAFPDWICVARSAVSVVGSR